MEARSIIITIPCLPGGDRAAMTRNEIQSLREKAAGIKSNGFAG